MMSDVNKDGDSDSRESYGIKVGKNVTVRTVFIVRFTHSVYRTDRPAVTFSLKNSL